MISKKHTDINVKRCVSCGACAKECPGNAVAIHKGCYAVADNSVCVGCGLCTRVCPADCIKLIEREAVS